MMNTMTTKHMNLDGIKLTHICFDSIGSTQVYARQLLEQTSFQLQDNELLCISAKTQTSGIGKFGAVWHSPEGNVYATFIKRLNKKLESIDAIQKATLAAAQVFEKYHITCTIKWLNDILLNDQKVSGILCDAAELSSGNYLLIGIGVNLVANPTELNATSILRETGVLFAPEDMIYDYAVQLNTTFSHNRNTTVELWSHRLAYVDRYVRCIHSNGELVGKLIGVNSMGMLQLQVNNKICEFGDCKIVLT